MRCSPSLARWSPDPGRRPGAAGMGRSGRHPRGVRPVRRGDAVARHRRAPRAGHDGRDRRRVGDGGPRPRSAAVQWIGRHSYALTSGTGPCSCSPTPAGGRSTGSSAWSPSDRRRAVGAVVPVRRGPRPALPVAGRGAGAQPGLRRGDGAGHADSRLGAVARSPRSTVVTAPAPEFAVAARCVVPATTPTRRRRRRPRSPRPPAATGL